MVPHWSILRPKLSIIGLIFLGSCSKKHIPEAPIEVYEQKASIEHLAKESYLSLPISLKPSVLQKKINDEFKGLIHDDNSFESDDLKLKIWKLNDLTFKHQGQGVFEINVPLKIWVEKRIQVLGMTQSASTEFEILAKFSTIPSISKNWEFQTSTSEQGFSWISPPRLSIAGFSIPIEGILGNMIIDYQGEIANLLDDYVSKEIDFKTSILAVWNTLQSPMQLSEKHDIWLQITPKEVLMRELSFPEGNIETSISIKALLNATIGQQSDSVKYESDLPEIHFTDALPDGFELNLQGFIPFEEVEKIAKDNLEGQIFTFKDGEKSIEIMDLEVYGSRNNQLVLKAKIKGDLRGYIFLMGSPVFDQKRKTIVLKNIEIDLKTKDLLSKVGSWILEGRLEKQIEDELEIPVHEMYDLLSEQNISNSIKVNELELAWNLKELKPEQIIIDSKGLITTLELKGHLEVKLP